MTETEGSVAMTATGNDERSWWDVGAEQETVVRTARNGERWAIGES